MTRRFPQLKTSNKNKVPNSLELPKEVEDKLDPEELKFLKDLPADKLAKLSLHLQRSETSSFSGPLPPPEILKGYNDIIDKGAERILIMAEKQSDHRISLETDV